jgi:hypothetical protein
VHLHAETVRVLDEGRDLVDGVRPAQLGRLGERQRLRLRTVLVLEAVRLSVDELWRQLAVPGRNAEELEPAPAFSGAPHSS